jgi:nucleoside-diphosphate-sugar epimerase
MITLTERILVIGANGQLGSELTKTLWERYGQENVLATDIKDPNDLLSEGNFKKLNALDRQALNETFQKNRFTQVYHLAAILSAKGEQNPENAWNLNMNSLLGVLQASVDFGIKRVYWPSSIAVFGPSTPKKMTPQRTIMEPTTVYGISKLAGERWCEWYHRKYGLDVRSLRYPGLIGYKSKPGGGTTDYAVDIYFKAVQEQTYRCFLEPNTYLPMMYMEDAIKATLELMEAPAERITVRSSYNLSAMSICPEDIAGSIRRHVKNFSVSYDPDGRQKIADSWPDSVDDSQARADWNWDPDFGLEAMTNDMLSNLRKKESFVA